MDTIYYGVYPDELPEYAQELLDPKNTIDSNVLFFMKIPGNFVRFILAFCIGIPFLLGAVAFSYFFIINFYHNSMDWFDTIIAIFFIILSYAISWFFYDWCMEGLKIRKLIKSNQWRQGIYLFQEVLIIQLESYACYFLPKGRIDSIKHVKVTSESGPGHHFRIDINFHYNGEPIILELPEHNFDLFENNIDFATFNLTEFSKLYEVLEKWHIGDIKALRSIDDKLL